MPDARRAVCARVAPGAPRRPCPRAALRCHLSHAVFPTVRPSGAGSDVGGQAPRHRPRRSYRRSSGGVPALPPSASRRETPQTRPTCVGLTRDTTRNTLCPKYPDPVGPGGACASAVKALRELPQPGCEATATGNRVCARSRHGYCPARAPNIPKTWAGPKGQQPSS